MIFKDYYQILGLETNKVTISEIKNAYREAAKKYHPDVNIGNEEAEEKFKDINEAYNILSVAATRRRYDRTWNSKIGRKKKQKERKEESVKGNVFSLLFGNNEIARSKEKSPYEISKQKGEDIQTQIDVKIEEAFYGATKKISLRTVDGKMKTFKIDIPAGIRNNEKVRLIGQGKEGKNGEKNGDLFIKINIKNEQNLKLKGYNLYTNLELTPWEAALGTKLSVNTIDDSIKLHINKGIQTDEQIEIEGKGYKDGKGGRGNLIVTIKIVVPKNLTKDEKELFEQLSEKSVFKPRM